MMGHVQRKLRHNAKASAFLLQKPSGRCCLRWWECVAVAKVAKAQSARAGSASGWREPPSRQGRVPQKGSPALRV